MFRNNSTSYDYDLFIFSPNINIHIATGGARIPFYLRNLLKHNDRVYDTFFNDSTKYETQLNLNLDTIVYAKEFDKNEDFSIQNYLSSFQKIASKGFYSFDKTNISDPLDNEFHLVAYPINRRAIDFLKIEDFIFSKENFRILTKKPLLLHSIEIAEITLNSTRLLY
ncbi:hypothetical protein [Flavobacterium sp. HJSW_4]|uniref:hypothetical protein n=1 Tax=Flavobacterium sp. HJSW_4 TaxID=3344660 RepID=UPI0035F4F1BD